MADTPAMGRLRGGHYNTSDWNSATNQGGMGGDGHRYALIPPKAPQTPTYPVMVNDLVAVLDEAAANASAAAGSASAAAGSASTAATALSNAQALLSNATLDGTSTSSTSLTVDTAAKSLTVATNKAFAVNQAIQVTRISSPTTWLRGTVTAYNAGTGALSFTVTGVNAPSGAGPWTDWTVSMVAGGLAGDAYTASLNAGHAISPISPRVQALDPNGANRDVVLPAANLMPGAGGPLFILRNSMAETGTIFTLDVKDNAGTLLRSLYPGDVAYVSLLSRATAAGVWDIAVIDRDEGGVSVNAALSSDLALDRRTNRGKVLHLAPTDANRSVTLPAATSLDFLGGPLWYIRNTATNFPLTVKNNAGTVLTRLSPLQTAVISCYNRSSAAGGWAVDVISNDPSGGVSSISLTADYTMSAWSPRTLRCTPDAGGRSINLPDATTYAAAGGPVAYIFNHSAGYGINVRAPGGGQILATVGIGQMATAYLLDRSNAQGTWFIVVDNYGSSLEYGPGISLSGRQPLIANGPSFNNKLSALTTIGKALWSYNMNNNLYVRVLTVTGKNVSTGPENLLTGIYSYGNGQAIALSDTYGVAVFCNSSDVYHQGFSINLSTGVCALAGTSGAWGSSGGPFAEIRMDRIPGQNAAIVAMRRSSDYASVIRLVSYNGSTLSASSTANGTSIELAGRHDIVAVSATEARHYCRYNSQLYGRPITLSVPSMTISVGSQIGSGGDSTDVSAAVADSNWSVTLYQDGSAWGTYARAWTGSMAGPQVTLSALNQARHGAVTMWDSTSGMFLYSDYVSSTNRVYLQEFTLSGSTSPYITFDPAKRRQLNPSAGLFQSNHSHMAAALTLSPSSGLLLFCDEGNSNYPTIVVVERSL